MAGNMVINRDIGIFVPFYRKDGGGFMLEVSGGGIVTDAIQVSSKRLMH